MLAITHAAEAPKLADFGVDCFGAYLLKVGMLNTPSEFFDENGMWDQCFNAPISEAEFFVRAAGDMIDHLNNTHRSVNTLRKVHGLRITLDDIVYLAYAQEKQPLKHGKTLLEQVPVLDRIGPNPFQHSEVRRNFRERGGKGLSLSVLMDGVPLAPRFERLKMDADRPYLPISA